MVFQRAVFLMLLFIPVAVSANQDVKLSTFYSEYIKTKTAGFSSEQSEKFIKGYLYNLAKCLMTREVESNYLDFQVRQQYSDEKQIKEVYSDIVVPKNTGRQAFYSEHIKQFFAGLNKVHSNIDPIEQEKGFMRSARGQLKSDIDKLFVEYKTTKQYPENLRTLENECSLIRLKLSEMTSDLDQKIEYMRKAQQSKVK